MNHTTEQSRYLDPINRTTVVDEILERLVGLVVEEGLQPGDKLLPERELMAKLSVGRSSLREAIKTLCALGVLEVRRGLGTFVGNGDTSILTRPLAWGLFLNRDSVQQVIEARNVIEVASVGWAAERATEEEIAAIGDLFEAMSANQANMDVYVDYDLKFHLAIAAAAHNEILSYVLGILQNVLRAWMETTYQQLHGAKDSMTLHVQIYEAIRSRDVQAARQAMAEHTSGTPLLAQAAGAQNTAVSFSHLWSLVRRNS